MVFPQGGDFPRNVQGTFKVLQSNRQICIHDNGTNVCGKGHKLKFPGACLSQSIGIFNSTDPTFQPVFPICSIDYTSSGFHAGIIFTTAGIEKDGIVYSTNSDVASECSVYPAFSLVENNYHLYKFIISLEKTAKLFGFPIVVSGSKFQQSEPFAAESIYRMAQFNPGLLPHGSGIYSDLYRYDVFNEFHVYNQLVVRFIELIGAVFEQSGSADSLMNIVNDDRLTTVSGIVDYCVGDETPPFITYISPTASGTVLRPRDQIIEFSLSDAIGGVDLSSVDIGLSSQTTGNINLLTNGIDQTGGLLSVTGGINSYTFRYTPNFTWANNDSVITTISGSDLPPILEGDPFYCDSAGVNNFAGDIKFKVENHNDVGASITADGDINPPFIVSTLPVSGTLGNSVATPVVISIADEITGIELGTITVIVEGATIVFNGVPTTDETVIVGNFNNYTITYNKLTSFQYGGQVDVYIYAEDRAFPSHNVLETTYNFSCIGSGSLRIENFLPAVGTTVNPHDWDIEVDIFDDTYGISASQSQLIVNNSVVSAAVTTVTSGIHFRYHPPNDFVSDFPTIVRVRGVNNNLIAPVIKENIYTLYFGQRLLFKNNLPYKHDEQVDVFVFARNMENFPKELSTGYFFTTYRQPSSDLGCYIDVKNPTASIGASINGVGPEHRYGKVMNVSFYVEDYDGHVLGPYQFSYKIEERQP